MKRSMVWMAVALTAGLCFAVNDVVKPDHQSVRLYYGLIGSEDYILGTVGAQEPAFSWQLHSYLPVLMMDHACAATETHVYAVSGYNAQYLFRCAIDDTVWETMAQPPQEICNGGCAIVGDTLYYCSGYSYAAEGLVDTLWKYSIQGDDWTSGPGPFSGTTYNWQPFVVACAGKVYYISGCNQPGAANPTREVHCYTPGAGWARVADLNQGSVFAAGWVYHDTIWFAGGNYNNTAITRTEFYCQTANAWVVDHDVFPELPYGVWGTGSGVTRGTGFIGGGVVGTGLSDSVMYFGHLTGEWTVTEPLYAYTYRTAGCGTVNGYAWIPGHSCGSITPQPVVQYEVVAGYPGFDAGARSIVQPTGIIGLGAISPKIVIRNFGTSELVDIPCTFWVDSGAVYNQTVVHAGPLRSGASDTVVFPEWNASPGEYALAAFTSLEEDEVPDNDSITGFVWVTASGVVRDRVEKGPATGLQGSPSAGVCRQMLLMPEGRVAVLLDISGRQVKDLDPGLNDIRHVAPGVYFVKREESRTTTKVVIQR